MAELNVNGKKYKLDVDPETPLLWVIREQIGLTGTKYGCGIGACGACTVLFEGQAVRSCAIPVAFSATERPCDHTCLLSVQHSDELSP